MAALAAAIAVAFVVAAASISGASAQGSAQTATSYILNRYTQNVNAVCVSSDQLNGSGKLKDIPTRNKAPRKFDTADLTNSGTMFIGDANSYNGSACVTNIDMQLYTAGIFTPLASLPSVVAVASWQVSMWRATVQQWVQLNVINDMPRSLSVDGGPEVVELNATSTLLNAAPPNQYIVTPMPRSEYNLSSDMLPIVHQYYNNVVTGGTNPLSAAILVEQEVDLASQGIFWNVAYIIFSGPKGNRRTHFFQASYFDAGLNVAKSAHRKLLQYYSSQPDSSSAGACANHVCYTCPKSSTPTSCYRGSPSYPGCTVCCYCT